MKLRDVLYQFRKVHCDFFFRPHFSCVCCKMSMIFVESMTQSDIFKFPTMNTWYDAPPSPKLVKDYSKMVISFLLSSISLTGDTIKIGWKLVMCKSGSAAAETYIKVQSSNKNHLLTDLCHFAEEFLIIPRQKTQLDAKRYTSAENLIPFRTNLPT